MTELADVLGVAGRTIVVTGSASGIGRGIACGLADLGARVFGLDVEQPAPVAATPEALTDLLADVSDEDAVRAAFDRIAAEAGRIHAVFSNAGIAGTQTPFPEMTLAEWRRVLAVNLDGAFLVGREAARRMSAEGGKLVFTSSIWGIVGAAGTMLSAYAASKGGVVNLVRHLALELAPVGITVNGIAPAGVRTRIADGFYDDPVAVQALADAIPLGRIVEPAELVGTAAYLASRASDYVTGQTLVVDGGLLAQ